MESDPDKIENGNKREEKTEKKKKIYFKRFVI